MATNNAPVTVSGVVEQTNNTGIKLDSGRWYNYSQYGYRGPAAGQPAPAIGTFVVAQIKNDKFLHALQMNGAAPANYQPTQAEPTQSAPVVQAPTPTPAQAVTNGAPSQSYLIDTQINARLKLIGAVAVSKPDLFTPDGVDTIAEIVRNLESFVLEELIASTTPEPDPSEEDLLEEGDI